MKDPLTAKAHISYLAGWLSVFKALECYHRSFFSLNESLCVNFALDQKKLHENLYGMKAGTFCWDINQVQCSFDFLCFFI